MTEDWRIQYEKDRAEAAEIEAAAVIPPDDDRGTYGVAAFRHLEFGRVKDKQPAKDGGGYVSMSTGGTTYANPEIFALLNIGDAYAIELRQGSMVTGWLIDGRWYARKTDEELDAEHKAWLEALKKEREEYLETHRAEMEAAEAKLPEWIASRLRTFHEKGGIEFEREGWGYELVVAELAVAYAEMGDVILDKTSSTIVDSPAVKKISREKGSSGNQHGMALALAKAHLSDPEREMAGTVSALSPLTGDAFYEGKDRG